MGATPNLLRAIGDEVSTTLSSFITDTDTSISLTDATGFDATGGLIIVDEGVSGKEEVIHIESISGSTATVSTSGRGLAGTTAVAHDSGATVTDILTKGHINEIIDNILTEHNDDGTHSDVTAATVTLPNNTGKVQGKDSGGTARNIGYIDSNDILRFGAAALSGITFDKAIYKIGTFNISATGSKAVTGVGFTPKLVIFFPLNSDGASFGRNTSFNIGYMDGSGQLSHSSVVRDDVGSGSDTDTSSCIMIQTVGLGGSTVAPTLQASKTSLDADGFTVNVTTYIPGPFDVLYLAFS